MSGTPAIRFEGFTDPWEQCKLGDLGFAQSGIGFPDAQQGGAEGVPFFKVSDMNTPGNERELVRANNYVTDEQIALMGWHPVSQVPAVFFAKVGAAVMLNRKRLVNEPFLLDNNTMAFSMDTKALDPTFGQSLFEKLDLTSLVQVGALPSYNASDVEAMEVILPASMIEQHQIGELFQQLDNLITLHLREPPVRLTLYCYTRLVRDLMTKSTSLFSSSWMTCRYVFSVVFMLACPKRLATLATDTPANRRRDAWVCLSP